MLGSNLGDYQNTNMVAKHQRKQSPFGAEKPIVSFRDKVETFNAKTNKGQKEKQADVYQTNVVVPKQGNLGSGMVSSLFSEEQVDHQHMPKQYQRDLNTILGQRATSAAAFVSLGGN